MGLFDWMKKKPPPPEEPEPLPAIVAPALRVRDPEHHEDGSLRRGMLLERTVIDGYPCAPKLIELDLPRDGASQGTLLYATLATAFPVHGIELPRNTEIFLFERDPIVSAAILGAPLMIDGLELPTGTRLDFENGLELATLRAPMALDYRGRALPPDTMIPFRDGAWAWDEIDLPEPEPEPASTSKSETRTLEVEETIAGHQFPAGTRVHLLEGRIINADLPTEVVLDGVPCASGRVTFCVGRLHQLTLAAEHTVAGISFRKGSYISLWGPDSLAGATLDENATIDGEALLEGTYVDIWEELGTLCCIGLARPQTIRGRSYDAGTILWLTETGEVRKTERIEEQQELVLVPGPVPRIEV